MSQYVYPAIFSLEEDGYVINFPDIKNCFTDADDLTSAMSMSKDVLCLTLYDMEKEGKEIPEPSSIQDVQKSVKSNEFVTLIACDTMEYRRLYNKKAVKKTLSIPGWLNELAEQAEINFSAVLQEALKKELDIQ